MDQRESRHMRLYLLGAFLAAVLLVYLWVLYDLQVNHYQEYADRSIRSIVRPEQVEASRGILTDRNGRVLVSNRSTYNLTFDASLLKPNQDENRAILQLVELCRQQNVAWNDSLPITSHPPYTYTVDELSDLHRGRFFSYLKNLEPARQALIRYLLQNPNLVDSPDDASAAPVSPAAKGAMALQEFAALQEQAVTAYLDQHPELADVRFSAPLTGARLRRGEALLDGLTAAQVTAQFLHNAGLTPVRVLQWMREDFALPEDFSQLDARLLRDLEENKNRHFANALDRLLPQKLIPVAVERSGIPGGTQCNAITREQRQKLLALLKDFTVEIQGFRSLEEAIVTAGGVRLGEVNPRTMESKLVKGLYFAGEMLDVDAPTGGYNLQIAFSTGRLAGESMARALAQENK